MIKAIAAVTESADTPFTVCDIELEDPQDYEVLVRIKGVGICHTDLSFKQIGHYAPGVLGHEGAGVVEKVGAAVTRLVPGDHVVLSYFACHHCETCLDGHPAYCDNMEAANISGGRVDGSTPIQINGKPGKGSFFYQSSFANYAISHENNTVKIDKTLPVALMGPLGCGLQTGAGAVINALKVGENQGIAIFGLGAVGLAAVMASKISGANPIIVVDIVPEKLELAKQLGATHIINGATSDAVSEIKRISEGGAAFSIECVGVPKLLEQAVESLRPTGVCGLLGMSSTEATASIKLLDLLGGRTVKGIIEGDVDPQEFIPKLIEFYRSGQFPFDKLLKTYPLEDINLAIDDMKNGLVVKPVLIPS